MRLGCNGDGSQQGENNNKESAKVRLQDSKLPLDILDGSAIRETLANHLLLCLRHRC